MSQNATDQLQQTIAALEAQRAVLGDVVVDEAIAALREKHAPQVSMTDEQRKLVTVLFADLAGWTKMSEQMDPEDVQAIQKAYFAAVTPAIEQHGGAVEKYIGDAVLAVFGVPQAHEDDAERAVRAALAMQEAIAILNDSLTTSDYLISDLPSLSLRIGIHTGLVVSSVDTAGDFVVTGDTVNLASRLESAVSPGSVLISHDTFRLVHDLFDLESLEPLAVKGKEQPVLIYLVQRARARPFRDKTRGVAGVETQMVGRDVELLILQNSLQDVMADDELRLVTVVGEAGVGKSRLLFEFERWADGLVEEIWYFKGRANPYIEHQPYGLLRNMLAARFNMTESDTLDAVRKKLSDGFALMKDGNALLVGQILGYDFSDSPAVKSIIDDPIQLREQALAALITYFQTLAMQDPVIILLEDLHWADDSSLDTLNHVAQALVGTRLFVLAAARPGLFQRRPHWGEGWAFHHRMDLRPLSKRAGRRLVSEIMHRSEHVPVRLQNLIVDSAEGNPFYIEEMINMLIDDGVIDSTGERWRINIDQIVSANVPATLTGVLQARLDRLSAEERSILQQASVVGQVFWDRAVAVLWQESAGEKEYPEDLDTIREALTTLRSREFVYRREDSAFEGAVEHIFKHAVLRDITYKSVLKRLRRIYHGLVADWLIEQTGERIGEYMGLIADHLQQAGRNDEAADYLVQAGDQARARNAYEESVVRYERAVAIFEEQERLDETARTYMKLGLSHHNAFEYHRAREAYEKGFSLWQRANKIQRRTDLPPAPHALRLYGAEPTSIGPAVPADTVSIRVIEQLFCGLVALDDELTVVPDIAKRWEISEDGCRYVFHLREDVTWSDGTRVTAVDFEYAWKRILNPATESLNASLLYDISQARNYHQGKLAKADQVGVRAMGDFTLVVELEEPAGYFLHLLTRHVAYPVPRHVVDLHGDAWTDTANIVTNGPFLLESWHPLRAMTFVRNPNYHGQFRGNVERVEFNTNPDDWAKLKMYEANELDSLGRMWALPKIDRARIEQRLAGDLVLSTSLGSMYLGLNASIPPFNDSRVRQALALATDKEALIDVTFSSYNIPATGGFVPPGIPGHTPGIGHPFDPDRARWLLDVAGFPDGAGFPDVEAIGFDNVFVVVAFLQDQWRENLGISIRWTRLEWNAYLERVQHHQPQLYIAGEGADYPDPDSFLRVGIDHTRPTWQNDTFEALLQRGNRTTDQNERIKLFQQADRLLIQEAAIMPLFYTPNSGFIKPWVVGLSGGVDFGQLKNVIIKPH